MQDFFKENSWMGDGLCSQTDPDIFFPESGQATHQAVKICNRCPVQAKCFEFAMENGESYGIWGGVPTRGRREMMKQQEKVA
jgi:hypothetical protein